VNTKYWLANLIAMLLSRIFAYVTNKIFVFKSKTASPKSLLLEMLRFILARGFTGLIDIFGLIFLVEVIGMDEIISKYLLMGIIILLNFVLGKKLVFRSA
jgi:putative flippase GtrA